MLNPRIESLPVLVLYPHNRCNCRCAMCDIWKLDTKQEISVADLERHLADIEKLRTEWVVFSGGEPLMHSDLFRLTAMLRTRGIRTTILTTGLLLERHAKSVAEHIDDAIVSLDGPPEIHNQIRGVPRAFELLERGVRAVQEQKPDFPIAARCTVQHANFAYLRDTAFTAKQLGLRSISYLAADLTSQAFNRPDGWSTDRTAQIALTKEEIPRLEQEIGALHTDWSGSGFILESREKLSRIVLHFRSHLGMVQPVAPRCNAPWVSAVVESDSTVRPCFFHPPIGRLNGKSLLDVLNSAEAVQFREHLDVSKNPVCARCVCSLYRGEISQ